MRELTQKQADIYKALFNPRDSQHLHKGSLNTLIEKSKTVFGHDIVKHFLIPSKFYSGGENICYYVQNIVLYAAYMGAIANNKRWPSNAFCNDLAELGLTCIKLFFLDAKAEFTDDFCEYLRQTIIESFKKQIENKERLDEIINRQFRYLAHKTSIRTTDPVAAYQQDQKNGTLSATNPMAQTLFYARDMLAGAPEKAFATDLVIRCQEMLLQYDFHLSFDSKMNISSIQRSQQDAVNSKARGYGSYDFKIGFLVILTLACWIKAGIAFSRGNEEVPYYLMGSFVLTLFSYLYHSHNEEPFLNAERKRYKQTMIRFEEELDNAVKIENTKLDYRIKSPYNETSESKSPLPVRIFTFAELPVIESVSRNERRHAETEPKGNKVRPVLDKTKFFQKEKPTTTEPLATSDLQGVPAGMKLHCVDENKNLFLLYDPTENYGGDWIVRALEKARVGHARGDTGLIPVGHLKVANSPNRMAVYELKNLHGGKGEAKQRLLIPVISLAKKDGTAVSVLDCRGALFLKDGLHKSGIEDYRFDPIKNQISHKENRSLTKASESSSSKSRNIPAMGH